MSKDINELVVQLLRREGFDVMKFHDGKSIIRFIEEEKDRSGKIG